MRHRTDRGCRTQVDARHASRRTTPSAPTRGASGGPVEPAERGRSGAALGVLGAVGVRRREARACPCRPRSRGAGAVACWRSSRSKTTRWPWRSMRKTEPSSASGARSYSRRSVSEMTTPSPVDGVVGLDHALHDGSSVPGQLAVAGRPCWTLPALRHEVQTLTRLVRAVDDGPDPLDVRVPAPLGATVGVAHAHAERRLLAAHFAHGCHDDGHSQGYGRTTPDGPARQCQRRSPARQVRPRRPRSLRCRSRCRRSRHRYARRPMADARAPRPPTDLRAVVAAFRDALRAHQEGINRLNVYPVPDGDTGTNMALTLESVVAELDGAGDDLAAVVQGDQPRLAHGGPGQLRRDPLADPAGPLRRCSGADDATASTAPTVAAALDRGRRGRLRRGDAPGRGHHPHRRARGRRAARRGRGRGGADAGRRARGAPATPARRGAGRHPRAAAGAGRGRRGRRRRHRLPAASSTSLLHVVDGRPVPERRRRPTSRLHRPGVHRAHAARRTATTHDIADLRYEVMYFLEAPDETIPAFKDVWAGIGDSIVVVGGDGIWNCHIHTDDIGAADRGRHRRRPAPQDPGHRPARAGRGGALGARGRADAAPSPRAAHEPVADRGGRRRHRRRHPPHLPLARRAGIVTGGQSMNPSTAQLLEAVEAAPADEVVILPEQQEHHPGGRAGRRADDEDGAGRAHPRHRRGLRRAARLRPRGRRRATTPTRWPRPPTNVVAGEVTQAVRDSTCDARPDRRGRLPRHRPRRHPAPSAPTLGRRCHAAARRARRPTSHEIVTIIEGEGVDRRPSPATSRCGSQEHRPDVDGRGPPRRPAALPVLLRHRVAAPPRRTRVAIGRRWLADSPDSPIPVDRARRASARRSAEALGEGRHRDRARPAHLLPAPLPRPHQRGAASATSRVGEEAMVLVTRASGRSRAAPATAGRMVVVDVTDGSGSAQGHVLQPAVARAPAARRAPRRCSSASSRSSAGQRQMTNPVVDLVGDKTGTHRARLPAVGEGRRHDAGRSPGCMDEALRPGRRRSPTRCPTDVLRAASTWSTARRRSTTSTCPSRWPTAQTARKRLVFDELLRVQLALVLRKRDARAHGQGHPPRRRRRAGAPLPRAPAVPAHRRAGAGHRRDRPATSPARTRCTGCSRATSAPARRVVAVERAARRRAGRAPGRADGAHRGAGRAARPRRPGPARRASPCPTAGGDDLFAGAGLDRALRVELLTNRTTARRAPAHPRRPGRRARSTSSSAPTRSSRRASSSGRSASW